MFCGCGVWRWLFQRCQCWMLEDGETWWICRKQETSSHRCERVLTASVIEFHPGSQIQHLTYISSMVYQPKWYIIRDTLRLLCRNVWERICKTERDYCTYEQEPISVMRTVTSHTICNSFLNIKALGYHLVNVLLLVVLCKTTAWALLCFEFVSGISIQLSSSVGSSVILTYIGGHSLLKWFCFGTLNMAFFLNRFFVHFRFLLK